jgi:hypothetical protein
MPAAAPDTPESQPRELRSILRVVTRPADEPYSTAELIIGWSVMVPVFAGVRWIVVGGVVREALRDHRVSRAEREARRKGFEVVRR